jgi:hypothetical protein
MLYFTSILLDFLVKQCPFVLIGQWSCGLSIDNRLVIVSGISKFKYSNLSLHGSVVGVVLCFKFNFSSVLGKSILVRMIAMIVAIFS